MKISASALLLVSSLILSGCAARHVLYGEPATDLSDLKVSQDRTEVEKVLADPFHVESAFDVWSAHYVFDGGYEIDNTGSVTGAVIVAAFDVMFLGVASMSMTCYSVCQKRAIEVLYDPSDKVLGAVERRLNDYGGCDDGIEGDRDCISVSRHRRPKTLLPTLPIALEWHKTCHAAYRGDKNAQVRMGLEYKKTINKARAYSWLLLASTGTHGEELDELARSMTSVEMAAAEFWVANWTPRPATCLEDWHEQSAIAVVRLKELQDRGKAAILHSDDPDLAISWNEIDSFYQTSIRVSDRRVAWRYACLAAHLGHKKARHDLASWYFAGNEPVSKDLRKAYVWYVLGGTRADRPDLWGRRDTMHITKPMKPDELAEAKRLRSEWKPNPAECESEFAITAK